MYNKKRNNMPKVCKKKKAEERPEIVDQFHFGIQKHDNAQSAFKEMSQEWGDGQCEGFEKITILNDETFEKKIKGRALEMFVKNKYGKLDKKKMDSALGRNSDEITDGLLDFNYFLYSKKAGKFYTSIMDFKDDFVYMWSDRQWKIFHELWGLYSFNNLIREAEHAYNLLIPKAEKHFGQIDDDWWDIYAYAMDNLGWWVD